MADTYAAASFRLAGAASSPTNLLTIENTTGATRVVSIRYLSLDVLTSAVTADLVSKLIRYWHLTGVTPTGGTAATKHKLDSAYAASQANTVVRMAASADGTASAITHAAPSGTPARSAAHPLTLTGVGQYVTQPLVLQAFSDTPLVLRAAETGLLSLVGNSATHLHYTVNIVWEEA